MVNRERVDLEPEQAREDVERLMARLAPMLRLAGVSETQINVARGRKYKLNHFADAFDWLHQFSVSPAYEMFCDVYNLRPPEVWENYAAIGVTELREQIMLQEAGIKLVKRWRVRRPRMFGKDKKVEEAKEEQGEFDEDQEGSS